MSGNTALSTLAEPRKSILLALKRDPSLGIAELARQIGISYEGVRQQLAQLELDGWITRRLVRREAKPGRPRTSFQLTSAGEHLFPKEYDELAVSLIDAAADRLGSDALRTLLEEVARRKVEHWEAQLGDKPFEERLEALTGLYLNDDPYCHVEADAPGGPRMVEMNCPFLEVARRRPALCSVTVSVLRRLLGREVVRVERFQEGHGRCVFKVLDRPAPTEGPLFDHEPALPNGVP